MAKALSTGRRRHLRVGVLGATGYAGVELLRLLLQHPQVRLTVATSQQYVGKRLSDVYPSLAGKCDLTLENVRAKKVVAEADLLFTALPHGTSMEVVPELVRQGARVIDLSADFRLRNPRAYRQWYRAHSAQHLLAEAVFGLPELHRKKLSKARLVAVPGCYPTGALLGLAPLFAKGVVRGTVVIDAKSGVTGAGRSSSVELSFSEVNENFRAYNVGVHRHTPEIEQELSRIAKKSVSVIFTPHLIPMSRGILSTMYVQLKKFPGEKWLTGMYHRYYRRDPFVRFLPYGFFPQAKDVRGSNDCAIGLRYDTRVGGLVVITAIDNLVKGAAGQAIQNMNLMYGWPEAEGLSGLALVP